MGNKSRKLGNPAAAAVAATAASKAAGKAAPAVKQANKDTKGAVSWLLVGGGVLGLYLLYKVVSTFGKASDVVGSAAQAASTAFDNLTEGMQDIEDATNTPITIDNASAKSKAAILYEAMDGVGTDWDKIVGALTGVTKADFILISDAFGTPRYFGTGGAVWPASKRNLVYWLTAELNSEKMTILRNMIPGLF